jgi:hypothetical protein
MNVFINQQVDMEPSFSIEEIRVQGHTQKGSIAFARNRVSGREMQRLEASL